MLRETHAADEAPYDVTTIVRDNTVARRVLEAGLPGLPRYTPVERILTLLVPVKRSVVRSSRALSPFVREDSGGSSHSRTDDVLDQRAYKQVVVRGYGPWLRRCRWLLRLPPVGTVLPIAYVVNFTGELDRLEPAPEGCRWLVIGLPASHPEVPALRRRYRPRTYESTLYVVSEPGEPVEYRAPRWEVARL